ncbi:MAG: mobile mystery protein B [Chitinophagales bacterium]|nr:mobile mystery protein B [Chitinophagales bacterium]
MGLNLRYLEGQTPLNEEEKEDLKIKSLTSQNELNELEQLNIEKAIAWAIQSRLKAEKILTEKFIQELHKKMFGDIWKWAGNYRMTNKNIGIHWVQIATELKKLLDDTTYWIEHETFPAEEIAIRFKHRIVSIHCFPNGNGRHSRLMADILMESVFHKEVFSWQQSNMLKADNTRKEYIKALKEADNGNLNALINFARN